MPSTYTSNLGIEKPGTGEQSGSWGGTVNDNMDILDRAINGSVTLTLSGTSSTLTTTDGTLSDGQYKLLVLGGTPSGTHTITISPNDAKKVYYVINNTAQSVVFTQGSGGSVTLLSGDGALIYSDGGGSGAAVVKFSDTFFQNAVQITGGTITGGTITGITDLAIADGGTGASTAADALINLGLTATAAELNTLDGITATTAELNILDGVTATTAELNILDGVTATADELNYVDGVTSAIQTQLDGKQPLDASLTALAGTMTAANKVPYATDVDTAGELDFVDEDDMASDSATAVPSQQSVKAYVDATVGGWEVAQTLLNGADASQTLTTDDFVDGYEYRLEYVDVRSNVVGLWLLNITFENTNTVSGLYITGIATVSTADDLWGYTDLPLARFTDTMHTIQSYGNEDANLAAGTAAVAFANTGGVVYLISSGGASKIKNVTIDAPGSGTFSEGVITLLRRKIYNP